MALESTFLELDKHGQTKEDPAIDEILEKMKETEKYVNEGAD